VVCVILEKGADISARRRDGWTAFRVTCEHDSGVAVAEPTKARAEADERDSAMMTPLHVAVIGSGVGDAESLIAAGADVNAKMDDGLTPLHLAARFRQDELTGLLLDRGADAAMLVQHGRIRLPSATG